MHEVLQIIARRRSIRRYKDTRVDRATIIRLLKAGMAAPSANNRQPWDFIVITERETLNLLAGILHPYARMLYHAPLCICVCGRTRRDHADTPEDIAWVLDCSAATQNILLAAEALGLGAVWCGVYPDEDIAEAIRGILNLPTHVFPLNVVAIGYPDEDPPVKDKWRENKVHWQRW